MQRNANMLKILKKCVLQILLVSLQKCSPLSAPNEICPSIKLCNALYIKYLQGYKWTLKEYFGSENNFKFIIARCEFRDELRENRYALLKDLVRFFKEYMPCYGYKHLCTEDDDYKYYQTLNLPCIKRGFMGYHCNYGAPLRDIEV